MKIVTSGLSFMDIDAYAGCIAYAELLNLQGKEAVAFSSANLNESIPTFLRKLNVSFYSDYGVKGDDTFILVDVSEPEFIEKIVDINRVEEVIDHHVGFEEFWEKRAKSQIEFIGAACTLVYERWRDTGLLEKMSINSAKLLVAGILDNTLNFKAGVTHERDHEAYNKLKEIAQINDEWTADYFEACEAAVFEDLERAIKNDIKLMTFKLIDGPIAVGQLVVWNGDTIVDEYREIVENVLGNEAANWIMNVVSIRENTSYLIVSNKKVTAWAEKVSGVSFTDNIARAGRLWLRKEIVKQDLTM
jgi:inorganic pyrophosphatase